MIFRKPYAFIIKHFRVIHLLLLVPMIYLLISSGNIVDFFRNYVSNGYNLDNGVIVSHLSASYINIFMYLAIIVIVSAYIVISFLLQNKEKPTKYYNWSIIYYSFLFVVFTVFISFFQMIENDVLSNTLARILRDIVLIVYYSEYFFIIFNAVRGVGFNLKKFNFKSDIEDLNISAEDSEEFEFLIGRDSYKAKRSIRRFFRELKYYYKENKYIFLIIFVVIILIIASSFYTNKTVYNRVYQEGESVAFGEINFVINDSFLTNLDINGNEIKKGKAYLVLQITLINRSKDDKKFNFQNLQLVVNDKKISPNVSMGNNFLDYGNPYSGSLVKGDSEITYVLAYEIDSKDANESYYIESFSGYSNLGGVGASSRSVRVRPKRENSKIQNTVVNKGTTLDFSKTHVGNTKVTLGDYELANIYFIDVNGLTKIVSLSGTDFNTKTLMILNYNLELDNNSDYAITPKSEKTFFRDFMKIRYVVNDQEKISRVSLSNPIGYTEKLIFKIDKEIFNAESIEAVVTVRNVSYVVKLK